MISIYLVYHDKKWRVIDKTEFSKIGKLEQHLYKEYNLSEEVKDIALSELEGIKDELLKYEIVPKKEDSWKCFPDLRALS